MAVDPVTNPTDADGGPWSFSRALECLRSGGRVRMSSWPHGKYLTLDGGTLCEYSAAYDEPVEMSAIFVWYLLATDWEMVSALSSEGG